MTCLIHRVVSTYSQPSHFLVQDESIQMTDDDVDENMPTVPLKKRPRVTESQSSSEHDEGREIHDEEGEESEEDHPSSSPERAPEPSLQQTGPSRKQAAQSPKQAAQSPKQVAQSPKQPTPSPSPKQPTPTPSPRQRAPDEVRLLIVRTVQDIDHRSLIVFCPGCRTPGETDVV